MKKVLAFVLAVTMLSCVAMAAIMGDASFPGGIQPGDKVSVDSSGLITDSDWYADAVITTTPGMSSFNTKNYSIKKVTYDAGKSYVESIALTTEEDEDELIFTFKEDYSLVTKDNIGKDLDITVELRNKKRDIQSGFVKLVSDYGFGQLDVWADDDGKVNLTEPMMGRVANPGYIWDFFVYKMTVQELGDNIETDSYGTLEFDTLDEDATVSVRVYDGDKFFLGQNTEADKKLLINNADAEAEISFLNFYGRPSFNSTATVYFYQVDKDGFVYERIGEGKIKKSAAKWSEDDGCWVLKTRTLGSYVFSDKALATAADTTDAANPETGASNIAGMATLLAMVSLTAAGALSIKK